MPREEDEDGSKEVLKVGRKTDDEDDWESESKKSEKTKKEEISHPPPAPVAQPVGSYPPPPPAQPAKPLFTSENLERMLGIAALIGVIMLFVGALLAGGANFADRYQSEVYGGGKLIAGIGLFIAGLFVILPIMTVRDLSKQQKYLLFILTAAIIIAFALLI
jgi:hypothetical protein